MQLLYYKLIHNKLVYIAIQYHIKRLLPYVTIKSKACLLKSYDRKHFLDILSN